MTSVSDEMKQPFDSSLAPQTRFLSHLRACSILILTTANIMRAIAADISGEWELEVQQLNDTNNARVQFITDDGKLSGTLNELALSGSVKADDISFTATRPNGKQFGEFTGRAN